MDKQLKLSHLGITQDYMSPGAFTGQLTFESGQGSVTVKLDNALSAAVLSLIASSMVRATRNLADTLTAQVFEQASINLLTNTQTNDHSESQSPSYDDVPF